MLLGMVELFAQVPIGSFRDHLSNRQFYSLAVTDDAVYFAGKSSVAYLTKEQIAKDDFDFSKWSKVNGLSDVEVARIAYDKPSACLVVAYANGNLDFIKNDELVNVPDVKEKQLTGDKSVRQMVFHNNRCYLVYPFGIVEINMKNYLVKDTWYTNRQSDLISHSLTLFNHRWYLATSKGVYSIDEDNPSIADFAVWTLESDLGAVDYTFLATFQDKVYANRHSFLADDQGVLQHDSVFVLDNGQWRYEPQLETEETRDLIVSENEMMLVEWQYVVIFDGQTHYTSVLYPETGLPSLQSAAFDDDRLWVSDQNLGVWLCKRSVGQSQLLAGNGPKSNYAYNMSWSGGVLAMVPGGYNTAYSPAFMNPVCNFFQNEKWECLSDEFYATSPDAHDMINVAVDPKNPEVCYVASWGNGLYKCVNGKIDKHYDNTNSPLQIYPANNQLLVSGLSFDAYGNLWVTNSNSPTIINVLKADGSWKAIPKLTAADGDIAQYIYADSRGYKWITFPRNPSLSLCVYSDNNTIDNLSDDKLRYVDMNANAHVESSVVKCITEDKDGEMWIGTNKGVKVIYYPNRVFEGTALPQNILLEQDGYTSVLLEFEEVSSIAVDGANRKWIGTSKAGVFLMNPSGTEELLHLTAENSSLLSDVIYDVEIDGNTGEVFFATDKGLCSYRGTATEGKEDYTEAKVFPNPVEKGYTGNIAVSGLMENSFCKIVDAAGHLIWQGYANGGELIWNGKDFKGRRPATGVFYVFCSSKSGKEKKVAKFLFIN